MAARLVRSRLLPHLLQRSERRPLSVSAASFKDPVSSSDATFSDQCPSTPLPPPSSGAPAARSWAFLKYCSLAAITATIGATSYASYAYTVDEVEEKANTLREKAKVSSRDDASSFQNYDNLVYSTAMKGKDLGTLATQTCFLVKGVKNRLLNIIKDDNDFEFMTLRNIGNKETLMVPLKIIELYLNLRKAIEDQVQGFTEPSSEKLLPDLHPQEQHVFTLVLDLNETLVYSDWKRDRGWRTFKRSGVDAFLEHLAKFYEVVVFSDQPSMYVDPVIERLDQKGCIRYRLSRAATKYVNGKHYRDLSKLNRDPSRIMYISGHALDSSLQPENCVPIKPWKLENDDTALLDLIPFLEYVALHRPADVRPVLASYQGRDIASEFIERSKEHQKRLQEQKQHSRFWRR